MIAAADILRAAAPAAAPLDLGAWLESLADGRVGVGWLLFGLGAQALLLGCLLAQGRATRRRHRRVLPPTTVYIALVAMVMLLVYASVRHDLVFVVGQLLNVIIALRILGWARQVSRTRAPPDENGFPVVEPDSADRSGFFEKK